MLVFPVSKLIPNIPAETCEYFSIDSTHPGKGENGNPYTPTVFVTLEHNGEVIYHWWTNIWRTQWKELVLHLSKETVLFRYWKSPDLITSVQRGEAIITAIQNSLSSVPLCYSLTQGTGRLPCPWGWNVTKTNHNLIHNTMIYLEKIMCVQKGEVCKDSIKQQKKKKLSMWAPFGGTGTTTSWPRYSHMMQLGPPA